MFKAPQTNQPTNQPTVRQIMTFKYFNFKIITKTISTRATYLYFRLKVTTAGSVFDGLKKHFVFT